MILAYPLAPTALLYEEKKKTVFLLVNAGINFAVRYDYVPITLTPPTGFTT